RAEEQLAVLERARLALVAIADDVFSITIGAADLAPLLIGAPAGASHAEQVARLERLERVLTELLALFIFIERQKATDVRVTPVRRLLVRVDLPLLMGGGIESGVGINRRMLPRGKGHRDFVEPLRVGGRNQELVRIIMGGRGSRRAIAIVTVWLGRSL